MQDTLTQSLRNAGGTLQCPVRHHLLPLVALTYCMPALYHCRLRDVCTVCNYILARAKSVGAGLVSCAQHCKPYLSLVSTRMANKACAVLNETKICLS